MSGADLDQENFHEHWGKPLIAHKIKPHLIELELTESARSICHEKALSTINHFANWGFEISLNDFGIGYSERSKLIPIQLTTLK